MEIDEELSSNALAALQNAFYKEYCDLVNKYCDAAVGLTNNFEEHISHINPQSVSDTDPEQNLEIVRYGTSIKFCSNLKEALLQEADQIFINGNPAFAWKGSLGWQPCSPNDSEE